MGRAPPACPSSPRSGPPPTPASQSTTAREELTLRLHVLPTIGEQRIERVGPRDIQRLVNSWRSEHAPRTVKRNYEVVRAMFGYAVRNDWLARNPCRNVNLPPVE